jgi:hypothetical protein
MVTLRKKGWTTVEGVIVGWLATNNPEDDEANIFEDDVAVVQTDDGTTFLRWLGNDWAQIDPPPEVHDDGHQINQFAAVGTRISFSTNVHEQREYAHLAKGGDSG